MSVIDWIFAALLLVLPLLGAWRGGAHTFFSGLGLFAGVILAALFDDAFEALVSPYLPHALRAESVLLILGGLAGYLIGKLFGGSIAGFGPISLSGKVLGGFIGLAKALVLIWLLTLIAELFPSLLHLLQRSVILNTLQDLIPQLILLPKLPPPPLQL